MLGDLGLQRLGQLGIAVGLQLGGQGILEALGRHLSDDDGRFAVVLVGFFQLLGLAGKRCGRGDGLLFLQRRHGAQVFLFGLEQGCFGQAVFDRFAQDFVVAGLFARHLAGVVGCPGRRGRIVFPARAGALEGRFQHGMRLRKRVRVRFCKGLFLFGRLHLRREHLPGLGGLHPQKIGHGLVVAVLLGLHGCGSRSSGILHFAQLLLLCDGFLVGRNAFAQAVVVALGVGGELAQHLGGVLLALRPHVLQPIATRPGLGNGLVDVARARMVGRESLDGIAIKAAHQVVDVGRGQRAAVIGVLLQPRLAPFHTGQLRHVRAAAGHDLVHTQRADTAGDHIAVLVGLPAARFHMRDRVQHGIAVNAGLVGRIGHPYGLLIVAVELVQVYVIEALRRLDGFFILRPQLTNGLDPLFFGGLPLVRRLGQALGRVDVVLLVGRHVGDVGVHRGHLALQVFHDLEPGLQLFGALGPIAVLVAVFLRTAVAVGNLRFQLRDGFFLGAQRRGGAAHVEDFVPGLFGSFAHAVPGTLQGSQVGLDFSLAGIHRCGISALRDLGRFFLLALFVKRTDLVVDAHRQVIHLVVERERRLQRVFGQGGKLLGRLGHGLAGGLLPQHRRGGVFLEVLGADLAGFCHFGKCGRARILRADNALHRPGHGVELVDRGARLVAAHHQRQAEFVHFLATLVVGQRNPGRDRCQPAHHGHRGSDGAQHGLCGVANAMERILDLPALLDGHHPDRHAAGHAGDYIGHLHGQHTHGVGMLCGRYRALLVGFGRGFQGGNIGGGRLRYAKLRGSVARRLSCGHPLHRYLVAQGCNVGICSSFRALLGGRSLALRGFLGLGRLRSSLHGRTLVLQLQDEGRGLCGHPGLRRTVAEQIVRGLGDHGNLVAQHGNELLASGTRLALGILGFLAGP